MKFKRQFYNQKRQRVANRYSALLANTPIQTPKEQTNAIHVYHQYTILSSKRDEIAAALKAANIASAIYYPIPLHKQPVFAERWKNHQFFNAEKIAKTCLSLPIYPEMTEAQIMQVTNIIGGVCHAEMPA